ncbi:SRPBCC family protein [Actinomadura spongiicola]|uniref:SRPBCC family protein n=1 Tax=Actinomadura spongiicola TaxID=2303421 RepID=UPI0018F10C0D|nr:SRPBCC family protein [Actinomadura spongiicola]
MKRGSRSPVNTITKRLPGGRKKRLPGIGGVAKNVPAGRAVGTTGGVLLGVGAAVAAGRALNERRNGHGPSDADAKEDKGAKNSKNSKNAKNSKKDADKDQSAEESGPGLLERLKDAVPGTGQNGQDAQKGRGQGGGKKVKVTNIVEHIDIGAPRRLVYDQWTQFQDYPSFMKKVESVEQPTDEKLNWKAKVFWSSRTWESTIIEQAPDEHIVWRSKGSKGHVDGTVSFHELSPNLTRVLLVLEYHPQGLFERTGNLWRAQGRRVRLELKHFRRYVMTRSLARPDEVEGWRGEIRDSEVVRTHEEALDDDKRDRKEKEEYEEAR